MYNRQSPATIDFLGLIHIADRNVCGRALACVESTVLEELLYGLQCRGGIADPCITKA